VSFVVESSPVPLTLPNSLDTGNYMNVPFTDLSYPLDGVTVAPALYVTFFAGAPNDAGGMELMFNDPHNNSPLPYNALQFFGPQMDAGPETSPCLRRSARADR